MNEKNRRQVCVVGLGFVGSAMAVAVASSKKEGFDVVGLDLPNDLGKKRIDRLNSGRFPFGTKDETLENATKEAVAGGKLKASFDENVLTTADIIVVDINLDVDMEGEKATTNLSGFKKLSRTIGAKMKAGALLIVESTVPPGTCEKIIYPVLKEEFDKRNIPEEELLLAHSYERVMPGSRYLASITNFWRVYSGCSERAADVCGDFLSKIIETEKYPLKRLSRPVESETAKIMENSYRAVNIAFIEEWARFAEVTGMDLFEIIEAIRVRPTHNNIRQPGLGVGGYCLTKDPLFPGISARELLEREELTFPFSELAVETNRKMPLVSVAKLKEGLGGSLENKKILLMGITYRQNVADTRHSPSEVFAKGVLEQGGKLYAHDPIAEDWEEMPDVPFANERPSLDGYDAVVFAVPHREYVAMEIEDWLAETKPFVLDSNKVLSSEQWQEVKQAGCKYASIGRGW